MSSTGQGMKRKEDITELINAILDQALRTRQGFTPDVVREFEREGNQNRQERARQQVRESTPVRQLGPVVARRSEETRSRTDISPDMKRRGIEEGVRLGEMMELAVAGRRPRTEWATS